MPPPDIPPPLLGIQQAAQAIAVERQRLNNGFAALQSAASLLAPGYELSDDGQLVWVAGDYVPSPPSPPMTAQETPPLHEPPPAPEPPPEPEPEPPPLPPSGEDQPTMREAILHLLEPGVRKSAPRIATEIGRNLGSVSSMLSKMRTDGQIVRIEPSTSGHSVPMFMRASKVQTRPTNESPSSTQSQSSGDSASQPKPPTPGDGELEEATSTSTASGSTSPPSPSSPSSTASHASSREEGTGLARSPKPRKGMKEQQRAAEDKMDDVVLYMAEQPDHGGNAVDLAEDLGISKEAMGRYTRELRKRGVLIEGRREWSRMALSGDPKKKGRQTVRYHVTLDVLEQIASPKGGNGLAEEPPAVGADPGIETGDAQPRSSDVVIRDALVALKECTIEELAAYIGIEAVEENLADLRGELSQFILKGMVAMEDGKLVYQRPTDPGAAARLDMTRTPEERLAEVEGRGETIAGTGRGFRAANKDVQALVDAAVRAGGKASGSGGHIKITAPDGRSVNIASTPASPRQIANDRTRLRRLFPQLARG